MNDIQSTLYYLFEEYEKLNGHSHYGLIAISTEKGLLRELMRAKVAADEYGLIANKGVEYYDEDIFRTNSDCGFGFVNYYIIDIKRLTREELMEQIEAEKEKAKTTFEQTVWSYPESKEIRNFMRECRDGDLNISTMLAFLTECKEQAGLTNKDIQFLKHDHTCQHVLYNKLWTFLEKENASKDWNNVRSFYSNERKTALLKMLSDAFNAYRANDNTNAK